MDELESALLEAVLGFIRSRLDKLVHDVARDPATLLASLLGYPPAASQVGSLPTQVQGHLNEAQKRLTAFGNMPSPPPPTFAAAVADLAGALAEIQAAINLIGVGALDDSMTKVVKQAVTLGGDTFSGLPAQLGLAPPGATVSEGIRVSGSQISYALANAAERPIPGPPLAKLTLTASSLSALIDFGATPALGLALQTGARVGLAVDSLIDQVLSGAGADVEFAVAINVDSRRGLTFGVGLRHRIGLPGKFSAPGVELRDLGLELPSPVPGAAPSTPALTLTGTLAFSLGGVIRAVMEGAGVKLLIDPALLLAGQQPLSLAVQSPVGVAVRVDAGPVRGGGYLYHSGTEYGGALDLWLGPIEIKAVGLIQTTPFSLVLVLSVEFLPAIQLGFGFTLNGVGGLLAIERRLATDALSSALRDHSVDAILFPKDPVGTAPAILDALRLIFPPQAGGFVVGPMLELGWGVPISFVTLKVGVVIALPDPKVVLLGSVRVVVPTAEAPLIDLRADLMVEITPEHLLAVVSLSASGVAGFAVSGDFGLLIQWAGDPQFALSAGGFHPHSRPPGELANLRRIAVDLSPPVLFSLRADAYIALTSNSVQLGAHVELKASVGVVGAEGHLSFDAIVVWAPHFSFLADLEAAVSLLALGESFAGVQLHLHLEGPGQFLARGSASLSLWFLPSDITFDLPTIRWGQGDNPPPTPVSPVELVQAALLNDAAWAAQLPDGADLLVRLREAPADILLIHPLGAFELRQRVVPLETTLDRVGRNPVKEKRVTLGQPTLGGTNATVDVKAVSAVMDRFAPGQYIDLTGDQKLSSPAFEELPAGARFAGVDAESHGTPVETDFRWNTVFPGEPSIGRVKHCVLFPDHVKHAVLGASAVGQSTLRAPNAYFVPAQPVALLDPGQVEIRSRRDLTAPAGLPAGRMSTTAASRILSDIAVSSADVAASLQLVAHGGAP